MLLLPSPQMKNKRATKPATRARQAPRGQRGAGRRARSRQQEAESQEAPRQQRPPRRPLFQFAREGPCPGSAQSRRTRLTPPQFVGRMQYHDHKQLKFDVLSNTKDSQRSTRKGKPFSQGNCRCSPKPRRSKNMRSSHCREETVHAVPSLGNQQL